MNDLSNEERAELRRFLIERFNLSELKDLAFDLGVGYELFKHDTLPDFARELLLFCERQGQISCLLNEVRLLRPDNDQQLATWLAKIPPCDVRQKIQVIFAETLLDKVQILVEALAQELGLPPESIMIVGAAWGSARLLLSVPAGAIDFTRFKEMDTLDNGRFHILSIEAFIFLPTSAQAAWRVIAKTYPPVEVDSSLLSTISWQAIQIPAEPKADVNDSLSDHWLSRGNNQTQLLTISRELVSKMSPGETERLERLFPHYTELAQIGQVKTVQQAQKAFALGGETTSLALVMLSVVFTAVNTWLTQQNRQTLAQLRLHQESDRAQLDLVVENALRKNQVPRQQRDKLRPYLTEAIAKEMGDPYSGYEIGLKKLVHQVGQILELLTYEQQLLENISQTRRYGDTSEQASRRSEIIEQLNRFSLQETNQTFNDLCELNKVKVDSLHDGSQDPLEISSQESDAPLEDELEDKRPEKGWKILRRFFGRSS